LKQQPNQNQLLNSGYGQQQLIPRSNVQIQNLLPKTIQNKQPVFNQKDFPTIPNGYTTQQTNRPIQSKLLAQNTYGYLFIYLNDHSSICFI